jgi:hypothetical protein
MGKALSLHKEPRKQYRHYINNEIFQKKKDHRKLFCDHLYAVGKIAL